MGLTCALALAAGCTQQDIYAGEYLPGAKAAQGVCAPPKILVVLDNSSSMLGLVNGQTKWDIARDAFANVLTAYDGRAEFGLMLFNTGAKNVCEPGSLVVPFGKNNSAELLAALATPPPAKGNWTPMAATLDAAVELAELKGENSHLLLITDGTNWCHPYDAGTMRMAPVTSVEKLTQAGITTHVIGFGASVDALPLNQMANAANNKRTATCNITSSDVRADDNCYYQANDSVELVEALRAIALKIGNEICDGEDNDCNGVPDDVLRSDIEKCPLQAGVCAGALKKCGGTTGWQPCTQEVYEAFAASTGGVYQATEICGDNLDNNCNGSVDENCGCASGATQPCGVCGKGAQTCLAGAFGECIYPEGTVTEEICNGVDDNCVDGVDEGCACVHGETRQCGRDDGECTAGVQTCNNGSWGPCDGEVPPKGSESCNGLDDDCDNKVDEELDAPLCKLQDGVCAGATKTCGGTSGWKTCGASEYGAAAQANAIKLENAPYEEDETKCDGQDNDCDGATDEGCACQPGDVRPCGSETGSCSKGTQTCNAGEWSPCVDEVGPSAEVCDGQDNNCNEQIDENLTQPCNTICGTGTQACTEGQWGQCSARTPQAESCNGLDDDCDGTVDGPATPCANGGVCLNGRCTDNSLTPPPDAMMAGGGCSCRMAGDDAPPALALFGLLAVGWLALRRRRRYSASS